MDLLKKYLVKVNILIRTKEDEGINLFERYSEFEEEPRLITWVYPDVIYPKENNQRNNDIILQDLITQSKKGKFYLQINDFKYNNDNIVGFCFKLTEVHKKENKNINYTDLIPRTNHEIMFDLLSLNYIRTVLVQKKSGLRNLRDTNSSNFITAKLADLKDASKIRKSKSESFSNNINNTGIGTGIYKNDMNNINEIIQQQEESSDDENRKMEVVLSKEKILELQGQDYLYIKNFIFSLPFHGGDISLEKHRPNREKYSAGKMTEPAIKVEVSKFMKRIEDKILSNPNLFKKLRQSSIKHNTPNEFILQNNDFLNSPTSPKKENNKDEIGKE